MSLDELISPYLGNHANYGADEGIAPEGFVPRHRALLAVDDEVDYPNSFMPRHRAVSVRTA